MRCEIGTAYGALSCLLARNGAPLVGVWGFSPQEKVSVPLAKYIYLVVFTGRQELSLCHYAPSLPLSTLNTTCVQKIKAPNSTMHTVVSEFLVLIVHCTLDHSCDNSIGMVDTHVNSDGVIKSETPF